MKKPESYLLDEDKLIGSGIDADEELWRQGANHKQKKWEAYHTQEMDKKDREIERLKAKVNNFIVGFDEVDDEPGGTEGGSLTEII